MFSWWRQYCIISGIIDAIVAILLCTHHEDNIDDIDAITAILYGHCDDIVNWLVMPSMNIFTVVLRCQYQLHILTLCHGNAFCNIGPLFWEILWPTVDSPHKGTVMQSFNVMFPLLFTWISCQQAVMFLIVWDFMVLMWCHVMKYWYWWYCWVNINEDDSIV